LLDVEWKTEGNSDDVVGQASKEKQKLVFFLYAFHHPFSLPDQSWMLQSINLPVNMIACVFKSG